jgi:hypothetical protein
MTATTTAAATQIHDVVLQLESLHTAFSALLEQAKQQLEAVDLNDDHIHKIATRIAYESELREPAARHLAARLADSIEYGETELSNRLITAITYRLSNIQQCNVEQAIDNYLRSEEFTRIVKRHAVDALERGGNPTIDDIVQMRLRNIIHTLYGSAAGRDVDTAFHSARDARTQEQQA